MTIHLVLSTNICKENKDLGVISLHPASQDTDLKIILTSTFWIHALSNSSSVPLSSSSSVQSLLCSLILFVFQSTHSFSFHFLLFRASLHSSLCHSQLPNVSLRQCPYLRSLYNNWKKYPEQVLLVNTPSCSHQGPKYDCQIHDMYYTQDPTIR